KLLQKPENQGESSGRRRIPAMDGLSDPLPAALRRGSLITLDLRRLPREFFVLDDGLEPQGKIAPPQVEHPGFVVHSCGELQEGSQVLSTQVQLRLGTAKEEALLRG